ncbi:MAG: hypothetical protein Q8M25_20400 [Rhodoferax sp.]|nr:hypothetical protein [Rhodoferax sp.]
MAIADRRLVGAPATGMPVSHDDSRCHLYGLVSHGDGQIARHACAGLA